ncbi:methyltransferase domain-containing protein [Nostoc sp. UHCC 0302]|uniref:class I SAM-dependent methyltransferase n=1 Tax=Nostoc sp. UHCC 0302 TaxID=3134896 RepID=UPI00311CAE24
MNSIKSLTSKIISKLPKLYSIGGSNSKIVYQTKSLQPISVQKVEYKPLEEFNYLQHPRKLNLGCGFDIRAGYLNIDFQDFHNPDIVADIKKLDMLPSDFYEEIIAQDCLEHFPRADTEPALAEWSRLLKSGGILKLRVPNLIGLLELFLWESKQTVEEQKLLVQCMYGTQAYDGDWHLTGFTQILLEHYLEKARFTNIKFESKDHWLFEVTCEKNSLQN